MELTLETSSDILPINYFYNFPKLGETTRYFKKNGLVCGYSQPFSSKMLLFFSMNF
jgi:hypothetical protein